MATAAATPKATGHKRGKGTKPRLTYPQLLDTKGRTGATDRRNTNKGKAAKKIAALKAKIAEIEAADKVDQKSYDTAITEMVKSLTGKKK